MRMYVHDVIEDTVISQIDVANCVKYNPSPLASMLHEEVVMPDGKKVFFSQSDVGFLLSQHRLSKELQPIIDDMLQSKGVSDLSDAFANLSDDDIFTCIKSRYIQAPSELQSWSNYLMAELDALNISKEDKAAIVGEPSETSEPSEPSGLSNSD